ncbi:hypothetical protein ACM39_17725 [Chryseobacterium sp. FH2]|uniref:hypothetical protein n=1 Tax=Chryseobacterium sp. FH2 TaxID=1674291 RepID=UPI00065AE2F2|nr:hypothetical protein [Chryseobacterium sp. FH2]KMQ61257.1 hypothetical protein ACM39_17725 [Chryseobacterium sp. FH2]
MKKTMFIIFLSFIAFGCKGQEPNKKSDTLIRKSKEMYYIPNINSNFETFDFKRTREETLKIPSQAAALQDSEAKEKGYYYEGKLDENRSIYRSFFEIMGENKKFIIKPGEYDPLEIIYYNNSPFMIQKTFYPNGNIKEKGLKIVKGNVYKGTWYYFDENGKLTHTIDNDKLFGFSWEDVEKFMEEQKIPMLLGNANHSGNSINRWSPLIYPQSSEKDSTQKAGRKLWRITWRGDSFNQYFEIVLDGDTGKMLTRKKYWVKEEPGDNVPEPIIEDFTAVYKTQRQKLHKIRMASLRRKRIRSLLQKNRETLYA